MKMMLISYISIFVIIVMFSQRRPQAFAFASGIAVRAKFATRKMPSNIFFESEGGPPGTFSSPGNGTPQAINPVTNPPPMGNAAARNGNPQTHGFIEGEESTEKPGFFARLADWFKGNDRIGENQHK